MAYLNDHAQRFRNGLPSSNPFAAVGTGWCPHCRSEQPTNTQSVHDQDTYAWKMSCERCGHVISRGVYSNVVMFTGRPLPAAALEWSIEPGRDRR